MVVNCKKSIIMHVTAIHTAAPTAKGGIGAAIVIIYDIIVDYFKVDEW